MNYQRNYNIWIALSVVLLIIFSSGKYIYDNNVSLKLQTITKKAQDQLIFISDLVGERLQKHDYQLAESLIKNLGNRAPDIVGIVLTTTNGFEIARYTSTTPSTSTITDNINITYSYDGSASLKIITSLDDFHHNNQMFLYELLAGYAFISFIFFYMTFILIRTHQQKQKISFENERRIQIEKRLVEAQKIAQLGNWEHITKSNTLIWSAEIYRIFEVDQTTNPSFELYIHIIHPDDRGLVSRAYNNVGNKTAAQEFEYRLQMTDGRIKYINERIENQYDDHGTLIRSFGTVLDITDRKLAELALQRSHKMEAVGQLAGGIAHDFNNILGIILGNISLLEKHIDKHLSDDEKVHKRIDSIKRSSQRAVSLIKQLLGFSRSNPENEQTTDINQLISGMSDLISQSMTPQIVVEQHLAEDLWQTTINADDFEDALLNLILNARDAVKGRGQITIETKNIVLDDAFCALNNGAQTGEYVQLSVSDNGEGISSDIKEHIFEPFFTTKEQGKGTGLGLVMVFSFINRTGGYINLYTEPGIGTAFRLYLPRSYETRADASLETSNENLPIGEELILIVDDEPSIVEVNEETLKSLGYRILLAYDAKQALEQLSKHPEIDLLFSDVVMPGNINGFELAKIAKQEYPELKILLTSGYTKQAMTPNVHSEFDGDLLSKPYSHFELAHRIRKLLEKS